VTDKKLIRINKRELPESWEVAKIEDISTAILGQSPASSSYNTDGEGLPFFQGKAEFGSSYPQAVKWCTEPKKTALKDDVLISVRAPVGPTNLSPAECCIGRGLAAIRPNDGISYKYLLYYLRSIESEVESLGTGTTFKAISGAVLRNLPVSLAPQNEQKRIVAEIEKQFSRLDEAVDSLKRVKANLKRYKAFVLKAAVEGKLTEEWRKKNPDVEPADKILERILVERCKKWEEAELARMKAKDKVPKTDKWKKRYKEPFSADISGFPSLPIGWCWAAVEQLSSDEERSIQSGPFGSNLLHSEFQEIGKLAIGIDNVKDGYFSMGSENRISNKKFKELAKYSARPEDVLVTVMSTIGRTCVVPKDIEPAIITKHVYRITVNKELVSPHFLNFALWGGPIVLKQIRSQVRGQTRPGLNGTIIRQLIIPVPPLAEQQEILSITNQQLSNLDVILPTVKKAELRGKNLRSSILEKAFSGKLVKQDPLDEPASVLLDRIKRDTAYEPLVSKEKRKRRKDKREEKVKTDKIRRPLKDVLSGHPDGITPEALLTEANYSVEEIDAFYAHLANIADQIEQDKPVGSKALRWPYEAQVILRLRKQ
jgi:type I restriction enzyme S subunit